MQQPLQVLAEEATDLVKPVIPQIVSRGSCPLRVDEIKMLTGVEGDRVNPTDIWNLEYTDGSKTTLKLFLARPPDQALPGSVLADTYPLLYEMHVYRYILQRLMSSGICTQHFIPYVASGENCTAELLVHVVRRLREIDEKNVADAIKNTISKATLIRNLEYLIGISSHGRPAIHELVLSQDIAKYLGRQSDVFNTFRWNFLELKSLPCEPQTCTLTQFLLNFEHVGKQENDELINAMENDLWGILFQLAYTCYCMSLAQLVQNTLHADNILLELRSNVTTEMLYIVEHKIYILRNQRFCVRVLEFKDAYATRLGKNNTQDPARHKEQWNEFIANKDFITVMCSVYRSIVQWWPSMKHDLPAHLLNCIASSANTTFWKHAYKIPNTECELRTMNRQLDLVGTMKRRGIPEDVIIYIGRMVNNDYMSLGYLTDTEIQVLHSQLTMFETVPSIIQMMSNIIGVVRQMISTEAVRIEKQQYETLAYLPQNILEKVGLQLQLHLFSDIVISSLDTLQHAVPAVNAFIDFNEVSLLEASFFRPEALGRLVYDSVIQNKRQQLRSDVIPKIQLVNMGCTF